MTLNIAIPKICKTTLAMIIIITLLAACTPTGVITTEGGVVDSETPATVKIPVKEEPTFTVTLSATSTVPLSLEGAEQGITNALGVDLHNLAGASGVTGEIAKTYPEIQDVIENNFPITIEGEVGGAFTAIITDFIIYNDNNSAPRFFGKVMLAEVELSYLDALGQEQQIWFPIELYDEISSERWLVGTSIVNRSMEEILTITKYSNHEIYNQRLGQFLLKTDNFLEKQIVFNEDTTGALMTLDTIYPTSEYGQNSTSGLDFDLLTSDASPYTEDDLVNFRASGDPQYLPEVNGKHYLWPAVDFAGSVFNIVKDREQ